MKHFRIIFALLLVVIVAMVGIFYVEGVTTPIIDERLAKLEQASLYEMFNVDPENAGTFELQNVSDQYPDDQTVKQVFVMMDGSKQVGVIYSAETAGINPGIKFLFGLNSETNESVGVSIIANAETAGIGKDWLEDLDNIVRYSDVSLDILKDEGLDTTAGVTLTSGGLNVGIKNVLIYHGVNFLGEEAPETPDEMVERLKGEWFPNSTLNDVYSNFEENPYITEVYESSTGGYFFNAVYTGFNPSQSNYIVAVKDGTIIGFSSVVTFETLGIGQLLVEAPEFASQFANVDLNQFVETGANNEFVDTEAGSTSFASYTLIGINDSMAEVADFYNKQIVGVVDEIAPVLIVNTLRPTTFEVGATAPNWELYVAGTDNEDDVVVVTNDTATSIDFNVAGSYTITFSAQDAAGNEASVTVDIEITDAPVEFVVIPVPETILPVLEAMDTPVNFHDEGITTDLIEGVYTGRDAEGNVTSVFYNVASDNGNWSGSNLNKIMVQFTLGTNTIEAVNVFANVSTYYAFGEQAGNGEDFDSPIIAGAWIGIDAIGSVSELDLDSVSGTTAEDTFPSMIESIDHVITYQIENNIGGAE